MSEYMNEVRILIVDDNRDLADSLAVLLRQEGYIPAAVYTGEDAVARVLMEHYHLAVIDVRLPGMDGIDVFRAIRKLRPETAGIMITSHPADGSLDQLRDQGVMSILSKPLPIPVLLSRIAELRPEKSILRNALPA